MKKSFNLVAAIALLAVGALASCGNNNGTDEGPKDITLTFSGPTDNQTFYEGLFTKFVEARKAAGDKNTYTINYIQHGEDKVDSEVTDWAGEGAPDVYCYASDKILPLYAAGALAELRGEYKDFVTTQNNEGNVGLATFNGKVLAYPYDGSNTYFLYYDKTVFTTAPTTWEEISAKCAETKAKFAYPLTTGFYSAAEVVSFGAGWELTLDKKGAVTKVEADFDTDKGYKAGKAMKKLMRDPSFQLTQTAPLAKDGVIACVDGTWNYASYKDKMGDSFACTIMPTITIDSETKITKSFLGGKLLGVNPAKGDDAKLVAAHELAKFITSKDIQLERYNALGTLPTNKEALSDANVAKSDIARIITAQSAANGYLPQSALPSKIWNAPEVLAKAMIDEKKTDADYTDEYIKQLMDQFNATLETVE